MKKFKIFFKNVGDNYKVCGSSGGTWTLTPIPGPQILSLMRTTIFRHRAMRFFVAPLRFELRKLLGLNQTTLPNLPMEL